MSDPASNASTPPDPATVHVPEEASNPNAPVAPEAPPSPPAPDVAPELYACIDVGTNSVKMIVADLANGGARRVWEQSVTTRLGEGMSPQAPRLREIPMRRALDAIADFVQAAQELKVRDLASVGTAALRDAENRADFLRRVQERCGLTIEVIPGEEEARLSYLAVRRDPLWRGCSRLLVIDIGGGSTELIVGEENGNDIASRVSVNLGAVKLTESILRGDPPTVQQLATANQAVQDAFAQAPLALDVAERARACVVGVGGTFTNLAAMVIQERQAKDVMHGYALTADALENEIERLAVSTVAERQQFPGLDPSRADIILGGAILLSQALARIGTLQVAVSTRGLRWGVLFDRFAQ